MSVVPVVSVVVPAYDAAPTIASTLSRLKGQSFSDFEVIVVDDGSTDETASLAEGAALQDPRIRLLRTSNGGVSSARNAGLDVATGRWVLFLDADDWLHDDFLKRMLAALAGRPGSRVARCRHARVAPSGAEIAGPPSDPDQQHFFETLARRATGASHAYLTETTLVREVGGFDETLAICEDWDLWQRVARTGAGLATVPQVLAYYRMQTDSLSSDGARLLRDARTVLVRGMSADARVPRPDPRWALGVPAYDVDVALQPIALWCATRALVAGRPWRPLFDQVQDWSGSADQADLLWAFFEGFLLGHGIATDEIGGLEEELGAAASDIFGETAARRGLPALGRTWFRGLGHIFAQSARDGFAVKNVVIPTDGLLPAVQGAPRGERLVVRLRLPGRVRRVADTVHWRPLTGADMASLVVGSAARRGLGALRRRALGRLAPPPGPWTGGVPARLRRRAVGLVQQIGWHLEELAVDPGRPSTTTVAPTQPSVQTPLVEDARPSDPATYWEEVFSRPDPWQYDSDYERVKYERSLAMLDGLTIGRALEVGCAEGHFTHALAGVVGHLHAVDISAAALARAAERCADRDNVELSRLDLFHEDLPGVWDLVVCSEMLYYTNDEALLAGVARKLGAALAPGGLLLSAHAHLVADEPGQAGFDWDHPFGGKRILQVLADAGDLVPVRRLVTPLYSIVLYRRRRDVQQDEVTEVVRSAPVGAALSPHVESGVLWTGAVRTRSEVARSLGYDVPILMYHRITDEPNPALARWAVSPAAFERQMTFLRRRGFHTLSMHQLVDARRRGRPLAGRPVVLTFDDAYVDFLEHALPVLRRKGFDATVFVPTGHLGGVAEWDSHAGPPAPIMDRAELADVAGLGVELGSHLHTHRRVDELSFDDLLHEAVTSRRILAEVTGTTPAVVATPYGVLDEPAMSVLRTAGFALVATTDHGAASLVDVGRSVPRLEVSDGSLTHLHALLGPGIEPPTEDERAAESEEPGSPVPVDGDPVVSLKDGRR